MSTSALLPASTAGASRVLCTLLACAAFVSLPAAAADTAEVRAMAARGEGEAALAKARATFDAQPRDAAARFQVGVVLMDLHRDPEALDWFTAMAQDHPELPDPQNNIALLEVRAGRLELARMALERSLRSDPLHRTARANLGRVYLMLAVQAWDRLAEGGALDAPLQRQLEGARVLLKLPSTPGR